MAWKTRGGHARRRSGQRVDPGGETGGRGECSRELPPTGKPGGRVGSSPDTQELQAYLKITAPFDGVVTDRMIHPGGLVGPGNDMALLTLLQVSHLRLVVPVPEEDISGIVNGASAPFQVPAWPERNYSGTIARISHALDPKTRTMAIELDVMNRDGSLAPGMYPTVKWPVRRARPSLFVPKTSVVTTTERTFVIRNRVGKAEWVDVKKGAGEGDLIEVMGDLKAGDLILRRATDEVRDGSPLQAAAKSKR